MRTFVKFEGSWLVLEIAKKGAKFNIEVVDIMPDRRQAQRAILSWFRAGNDYEGTQLKC